MISHQGRRRPGRPDQGRAWGGSRVGIMCGLYYNFSNLRFRTSPNINDLPVPISSVCVQATPGVRQVTCFFLSRRFGPPARRRRSAFARKKLVLKKWVPWFLVISLIIIISSSSSIIIIILGPPNAPQTAATRCKGSRDKNPGLRNSKESLRAGGNPPVQHESWLGSNPRISPLIITMFRGNHLSNTTSLTHVFFKVVIMFANYVDDSWHDEKHIKQMRLH